MYVFFRGGGSSKVYFVDKGESKIAKNGCTSFMDAPFSKSEMSPKVFERKICTAPLNPI